MPSSSPVGTPKLQLAAEQLSTGECWNPRKKYTPRQRAKEKPQQDGRRDKITIRIKPHTQLRHSEGSNKTLCAPEDSTETEPDLAFSVEATQQSIKVRSILKSWAHCSNLSGY